MLFEQTCKVKHEQPMLSHVTDDHPIAKQVKREFAFAAFCHVFLHVLYDTFDHLFDTLGFQQVFKGDVIQYDRRRVG